MAVRELRNFQHLSFEKGETIFHAGDIGKHAYLINSGAIKLYKMESGKQQVLGCMKPGQVLGEMAIITGAPRTASAEALEPSELLAVDESVLRNVLSRCLPLVKSLTEQFIQRIQDTEQKIKQGQFDFSASRCHEMETTLRRIVETTEQELSESDSGHLVDRQLLSNINQSCIQVLKAS